MIREGGTDFSKGFAFLRFETNESVEAVLGKEQILCGKKVECKKTFQKNWANKSIDDEIKKKIYLEDLSLEATDNDLIHTFSSYGTVKSAYIVYCIITKKSKGFGYVIFEDLEIAELVAEKKDF